MKSGTTETAKGNTRNNLGVELTGRTKREKKSLLKYSANQEYRGSKLGECEELT